MEAAEVKHPDGSMAPNGLFSPVDVPERLGNAPYPAIYGPEFNDGHATAGPDDFSKYFTEYANKIRPEQFQITSGSPLAPASSWALPNAHSMALGGQSSNNLDDVHSASSATAVHELTHLLSPNTPAAANSLRSNTETELPATMAGATTTAIRRYRNSEEDDSGTGLRTPDGMRERGWRYPNLPQRMMAQQGAKYMWGKNPDTWKDTGPARPITPLLNTSEGTQFLKYLGTPRAGFPQKGTPEFRLESLGLHPRKTYDFSTPRAVPENTPDLDWGSALKFQNRLKTPAPMDWKPTLAKSSSTTVDQLLKRAEEQPWIAPRLGGGSTTWGFMDEGDGASNQDNLKALNQAGLFSNSKRNAPRTVSVIDAHGSRAGDEYLLSNKASKGVRLLDFLQREKNTLSGCDTLGIGACNKDKADIPGLVRKAGLTPSRLVYTEPGYYGAGHVFNRALSWAAEEKRPWLFPSTQTFRGDASNHETRSLDPVSVIGTVRPYVEPRDWAPPAVGATAGLVLGDLAGRAITSPQSRKKRWLMRAMGMGGGAAAGYYTGQHLKAASATVDQLLKAKEHSDAGRYTAKQAILRKIIGEQPADFKVDQPKGEHPGITHKPSGFKIHAPRSVAAMITEKSSSVPSDLRKARNDTHTHPTPQQAAAGNYRHGQFSVRGFTIKLENPQGSTRHGKDSDGRSWSRVMVNDYGYFKGIQAVDGDRLDVFIGPDPENGRIFVVDQHVDGQYDESKVMLGYPDEQAARKSYLAHYPPSWKGLKHIREMSDEKFREWTRGGQTTPVKQAGVLRYILPA